MAKRNYWVRAAKATLVLTLLFLAVGCKQQVIVDQNAGESVEFETVKKGRLGFGYKTIDKPEYKVFRTKKAWVAFWNESEARMTEAVESPGPEIAAGKPYVDPDPYSQQLTPFNYPDFRTRDMIVGAFFKASYGYEVTIFDIRRQPDKLLVKVELKVVNADKPGMTAPYHLVKLRDVDLPVKFLLKDERPRY